MTIEEMLKQQQEQEKLAKAERDAQLKMLLEKPTPVDTRAAAGFIDQMYGSNTMAGAKAAAEQAATDQDLMQKLLEEQRSYDAGSSAAMRAAIASAQDEGKQASIDKRADRAVVNSAFKDIKQEVGKERELIAKTAASLDRFDEALNSRDPERINSMLSVLAKDLNREAGALTESDVDRQFLQTYDMKVKQFLSKFGKGQKLKDQDIAPIVDTLRDARRIVSGISKKKLQGLEASYAGNPTYLEALNQNKEGVIKQTAQLVDDLAVSKFKGAGGAGSARQKLLEQLRGKK